MTVYYNDNDAYCCRVLRKRIADEALPYGRVDTRDIEDVDADEVRGATAWHLFAGIGGFPLGLAWAGWPDSVSVLTAGFPCQPASVAGKRAGMADERWVWAHAARLISDLRPDYVFLENVPGLLSVDDGRAFGTVIGDLESCGYVGEWTVLSAADVGAPHRRDRVWIVGRAEHRGHVAESGRGRGPAHDVQAGRDAAGSGGSAVADTEGNRIQEPRHVDRAPGKGHGPGASDRSSEDVADASDEGLQESEQCGAPCETEGASRPTAERSCHERACGQILDTDIAWQEGRRLHERVGRQQGQPLPRPDWRQDPAEDLESGVGRVAHGIPDRVDRLKALGNSVVPQCVEFIARQVIANMEAA
jgi:DNA (cytosine-5)-methyltransferase 1